MAAWTLREEFGFGDRLLERIGGFLGADLVAAAKPEEAPTQKNGRADENGAPPPVRKPARRKPAPGGPPRRSGRERRAVETYVAEPAVDEALRANALKGAATRRSKRERLENEAKSLRLRVDAERRRYFAALAMEMTSRFGEKTAAHKRSAAKFARGKATNGPAGVREGSRAPGDGAGNSPASTGGDAAPSPAGAPILSDPRGAPRAFLDRRGRDGEERQTIAASVCLMDDRNGEGHVRENQQGDVIYG